MPDHDVARQDAGAQRREESPKAYAAFLAYRDLGPGRSLAAASRQVGKHTSLLKRWSQRHGWVERVQQWEAHRDEEQEELARTTRTRAYRRRVEYAEQLERVAMAGLRSLLVKDPESGETRFVSGLRPAEIASLIRVACHLLPTEAMEPLEDLEGETEGLSHLSRADLESLERILTEEEGARDQEGGTDDSTD